jgi:hypothetical protein
MFVDVNGPEGRGGEMGMRDDASFLRYRHEHRLHKLQMPSKSRKAV